MKRKLLSFVICAAMLLVSCETTESSSGTAKVEVSKQSVTEKQTPETSQTDSSLSESSRTDTKQRNSIFLDTKNDKQPEVSKVVFSGECDTEIRDCAEIHDVSGHVLHNGVVGRLGVPVEIQYKDVSDPQVTFYYDKNELRGVPEKNIILLYCIKENEPYNTVEEAKVDTKKCTVTAPAKGNGVYLLADAYQWYSAWGFDTSGYEYERDKTEFITDWEREFDTGSIMKLADKEWAKKNAPDFHVSTPQQLASVVYYVNGINPTYGKVNITLEKDIDLTGYDWKPMGWYHSGNHAFCGTVDGNGHIIKGMKIKLGYEQCGFIGYGWDVVMKDISFINADVSGTHSTGIAGGEIYSTSVWTNVYTQGKVDGGGNDYGAIIGREGSISFKNCSADVTVDGKPFEYFSYRQKKIAETPVKEIFHLTLNPDCSITRDEHKEFKSITWHIELDDVQILERGADNELTLATEYQWRVSSSGKHTVYLVAFDGSAYIRVSNIIEYHDTKPK